MSKFSVGDRVRILTDIYYPSITKGSVGVVTDVRDVTWPYTVFVEGFSYGWGFDEDDLEHFDTARHGVEEQATQTALVDNNPKTRIGVTKVPLHLVPPSAKHFLAMALEDGARKYGSYNWRQEPISISVYKAAMERHMDAFWDGENLAPDSGVHHVAHAMACCALLLDALTTGNLIDDRPEQGASARLQWEYQQNKKEKAGE